VRSLWHEELATRPLLEHLMEQLDAA